jgi:hypothetical protein
VTSTRKAERQPISLRLRAGQRDRVWEIARKEGKSFNEAVCDLVDSGIGADRQLANIFGSAGGFAFARALVTAAEAITGKYGMNQGVWLYDIENFDRAAAAIHHMLDVLRPVPETQEAMVEIEAARQRHLRLVGRGEEAASG